MSTVRRKVTDVATRIQYVRNRRASSCAISHSIQKDSNAGPLGPQFIVMNQNLPKSS